MVRNVAPVDRTPTSTGDMLEEVVSQIYRARLLIHTCCAGARPSLVDELDRVSDDLDVAIGRLQAALPDRPGIFAMTELPPLPFIHWAWSEDERRWISMTFHENQAWLARPDLDPVEFAFHQVML